MGIALVAHRRYTMIMARFLGRSGEKRFSTLCSDLGITCNEPAEDDHGWDHIVEFPHEATPFVSADMQRALPACFVQTKSHESDGLHVRMRLSNAIKLARSPNPCFVVLMNLAADSTVPTWHAAHFWDNLIQRTLKRAREATRDGISEDDFNDMWFNFTMKEGDHHDGEALLAWMKETVRSVGGDYAAAKKVLVPPPDIVGTLTFGPLSSIGDLVDHALGLGGSLPTSQFSMVSRRLDVDLPFPMPDMDMHSASLRANASDICDIRMLGPDGIEIELQGEVIVPAIPGLPEDAYKYRFKTPLVDIIWWPNGRSSINGNFSETQRHTPFELEQILRFSSWAGQGAVDVRISVKDEPVFGAMAAMDPLSFREDLAYFAELIVPLRRVSRHLKARPPQISIMDMAGCERLELFHRFMTTSEMQASTAVPESQVIPNFTTGVGHGIVEVGEWLFAGIQTFPIRTQTRANGIWSLDFGRPILVASHAFEKGNSEAVARLNADYQRLAAAPGALALDDVLTSLDKKKLGQGISA